MSDPISPVFTQFVFPAMLAGLSIAGNMYFLRGDIKKVEDRLTKVEDNVSKVDKNLTKTENTVERGINWLWKNYNIKSDDDYNRMNSQIRELLFRQKRMRRENTSVMEQMLKARGRDRESGELQKCLADWLVDHCD